MMNDDLLKRATAAWFRSGGSAQPASTSGSRVCGEKEYIVLENIDGPLAVYEVKKYGTLKRLKRWPKGLIDA